ncbi:lysis protein [Salmonella enterica]|nr:lysis protein [Salmonella enterica]
MNRITTGVIASLLIVATALGWTTSHYHGNAVKYKDQRDTATHNLKLANATITDMQTRQRDVAALDAKYTKELADAKAENDALRDDVAAGRRRLLVNATCPAMPTGKSTSASGVDNAARPRLEDSAQRDYFTLKERVTTMQKQLEGTQEYIRAQCRKKSPQEEQP